jgi:hypothetical protein
MYVLVIQDIIRIDLLDNNLEIIDQSSNEGGKKSKCPKKLFSNACQAPSRRGFIEISTFAK